MSEHDFKVVADLAEELGQGELAAVVRAIDSWSARCIAAFLEQFDAMAPTDPQASKVMGEQLRERLGSDLTHTLDELHGIELLKQSRPNPWDRQTQVFTVLLDGRPVELAEFFHGQDIAESSSFSMRTVLNSRDDTVVALSDDRDTTQK